MSVYQSCGLSLSVYSSLAQGKQFLGTYTNALVSYQHAIRATGGYGQATIELAGEAYALADWLEDGLGRHIEVRDDAGLVIYEGFVNEVDLDLAGLELRRGPLMEVVNRVSTVYTPLILLPDGTTERGPQTISTIKPDLPLSANELMALDSQARYGIIESQINGNEGFEDDILQAEDTYLGESCWPHYQEAFTSSDSAAPKLTITIAGYISWLSAYIYNYTAPTASYVTYSDKIKAVLAADPNGFFSTDYDLIEENVSLTAETEDRNRRAVDILQEIAGGGDVVGTRWIIGVTTGRRIYYRPIPSTPAYVRDLAASSRTIRTIFGQELRPWNVDPGQWVTWNSPILARGKGDIINDPASMFIEEIAYTAPFDLVLTGLRQSRLRQAMLAMGSSGIGGSGGSGSGDDVYVRRDGLYSLYGIAKWPWDINAEVNGTLRSWGPGMIEVIGALYGGAFDGGSVGIFITNNDDGTQSVELRVVDTANVAFASFGFKRGVHNSSWARIGYEDKDNIIMKLPAAGAGDPEEHRDVLLSLVDRSTGTRYRLKVDSGILGIEAA